MCRATTDGGRRCPAHSNPVTRIARSVRQRVSRYTRALDAAETGGDEPAMDRYTRLLQAAFEDMGHLEPPAPAPATRASEFTPETTVDLTDDQLAQAYVACEGDPLAREAILGCFEWRDRLDAKVQADIEADRAEQEQAWAAHRAQMEAEDPGGIATSITRRKGLTAAQRVREEYDTYVHCQWLQAEADCRGVLLNKEGISKGIDPASLFEGNIARAKRYASEELQLWWRQHGRMSFAAFRYQGRGPGGDETSARARADRAAAQRAAIEDFANV